MIPLSETAIQNALATKRLGRHVEIHGTLESTQTTLRERAAGLPEGAVVFAECQTRGRGRMERRFFAPRGAGLYMSLLLRPNLPPAEIHFTTLAAAVAVCRALEDLHGLAPGIKWVNDVFCGGKKICGILSEGSIGAEGRNVEHVMLGIGVNTGPVPGEVREIAASVGELTAAPVDRNPLAAAIFNHLEPLCDGLANPAERVKLTGEYTRRQIILNKRVAVHDAARVYEALVLGIDPNGALVIQTDDGEISRLNAGEVSLRF